MSRAAKFIGQGQSEILHFDLNHDMVATMDMICGGQAEILLAFVRPTDANRTAFESWRERFPDAFRLPEGDSRKGMGKAFGHLFQLPV